MENETKPMSMKKLTAAVSTLLEREEVRIAQERRKRRRRLRRRREEMQMSIEHLKNSIDVIKYCIVTITTVMAISLLILIIVVWQIGNEAERIKGEVEQIRGEAEAIVREIEDEADKIRDKIQNPMRTIGGMLGGQLDKGIGSALGIGDE